MPISAQSLDTLEFPKIRDRLARHTAFSASRELALALLPSTDPYEIRRRLAITGGARRLLDERSDTTIGGARDIRGPIGLARRGGVLDAATFLEIASTLSSGRRLRALLLKIDATLFPLLRELAEHLPNLQAVEDAIAATIGDDGTVLLPYTQAKQILDRLKRLCLGRDLPDAGACARFDKATRQGEEMRAAQRLLAAAVASVVGKNEERAVASLFSPGGTHAMKGEFAGSNDFEVLAFMVVLPGQKT